MRFAVISDIHGNLPALEAVLDDGKTQGAEKYIIAGDYCLSGPYPDECITRLRSNEDKYIIRGNEEAYLENLIGKDRSQWTDGQMQISYYCYRKVTKENLDYLMSLPHNVDFRQNGIGVHIAHTYPDYLDEAVLNKWMPSAIAKRYYGQDITSESLQNDIKTALDENAGFQQAISQLKEGVYIFGHTHIQWSYKAKDREVYLLNPGSCGLPLDGITNSVPYALLDISDDGKMHIEQRRISFDTAKYIEELKDTSQYNEANIWSNVIIKELESAREHINFFLRFTENYAQQINDERRPFALDTWEKAYELWKDRVSQGIFD